MSKFNYQKYYSIWNENSEIHRFKMINFFKRKLLTFLPDNKSVRILDIGSGSGYTILALNSLGFMNVVGIDISEEQVSFAKSNNVDLILVKDSIDFLNKNKNSFDIVLMFDVLEHIPKDKIIDFLNEVYSSLKNNGQLYIKTPNANSILSNRWLYNDFTHTLSFTENTIISLLKNSNFSVKFLNVTRDVKLPLNFFRKDFSRDFKKYLVRKFWKWVFESEQSNEDITKITFELDIECVAYK